jgi:transaldolase
VVFDANFDWYHDVPHRGMASPIVSYFNDPLTQFKDGAQHMYDSIKSLIDCGTKLWLDSIDPVLVDENRQMGATGATSNPIIVTNLIKTGRFDAKIGHLVAEGKDVEEIAWALTDALVTSAQTAFLDVWKKTSGNDGYVSFELDPLLEDVDVNMTHEERVASYVALGQKWSAGRRNRMIKVPATPAGLDAIEDLSAAGVPLNVTLIFSDRQYQIARDAAWRGAQKCKDFEHFKSVYSIFVSRIDVYTEQHCPTLSDAAQGLVGIVNAQRIWAANRKFWSDKHCPLQQEIIFASTGTKKPEDPPTKYVRALAGSDIQTNPPATNEAVAQSGLKFERRVDALPSSDILEEIDSKVDFADMEKTLMREGIAKFADPQHELLKLISDKRAVLAAN